MKKIVVILAILLSFASPCLASENRDSFVKDNQLYVKDFIITEKGKTMVPLRVVFDAFQKDIEWNPQEQTITSGPYWMQIDNPTVKIGNVEKALDSPPMMIEGKTYLPQQYVKEVLGASVIFRGTCLEINLTTPLSKNFDQINQGLSLLKTETILNTCSKYVETYSMNDEAYKIWSQLDNDSKQQFLNNKAFNLKVTAGKMLVYEMIIYDSFNTNVIYHGRWEDKIALFVIGMYCQDLEKAVSLLEKNSKDICNWGRSIAYREGPDRAMLIEFFKDYDEFEENDEELEVITRGMLFAPPPDCIEVFQMFMNTYQTYLQMKEFALNPMIPVVETDDVERVEEILNLQLEKLKGAVKNTKLVLEV